MEKESVINFTGEPITAVYYKGYIFINTIIQLEKEEKEIELMLKALKEEAEILKDKGIEFKMFCHESSYNFIPVDIDKFIDNGMQFSNVKF